MEKDNNKITYPIKKGTEQEINISIQSNLELKAPVEENTCIGKLVVEYSGDVIKEINIINTNRVDKKRVYNYILEFIDGYDDYLEDVFS